MHKTKSPQLDIRGGRLVWTLGGRAVPVVTGGDGDDSDPSLLAALQRRLQERIDQRSEHRTAIDRLVSAVEARGADADFTAEEQRSFDEHRDAILVLDLTDETDERYDSSIQAMERRYAELRQVSEDRTFHVAQLPGRVQVRSEEPVYRRNGDHSFLTDLYAHQISRSSSAATERLFRHAAHVADTRIADGMPAEYRDIVVSDMAGLVPPTYLLDDFADIDRAGRPFLNSMGARDLPPDGVSFTIPRGTTGTAAAMTAEQAAWSEQNYSATDYTETVELVTAQQDLSRTLFIRGGGLVDDVLFPDLIADAAVALDSTCLNGNGTSPAHLGVLNVAGINSVTYTDASPTVAEFWPKISDAIQQINSARYMPATAVWMHPRRWGWITSAVDSNGRPLFNFTTTPPNVVMGVGEAASYGQVVGTLQGLPVITDANIPINLGGGSNEDRVIIARAQDLRYWEDPLMRFSFEQTLGPAQVRLAVGRFSLFMAGRKPGAIAVISGTGLVAPTF